MLDHLCAPEPAFSQTAIPPGADHHGRNGFAGNARSLGHAQTIEIGALALDHDVGFAFQCKWDANGHRSGSELKPIIN